MKNDLTIYIGPEAVSRLIDFCHGHGLTKFVLVADENTYAALGAKVEAALTAANCDVLQVILKRKPGQHVIADEHSIMQVLAHVDREQRTYLAVGGGTLTDITRFVSHRTQSSFISVPAAPSVDGFTSTGASLVVDGLKRTFSCHAPIAVFADLATLAAAPPLLIAAGFGDMLGKFLSLADWKLGHILWDGPWDPAIAGQLLADTQSCLEAVDDIGARSERGMHMLMNGLIASGCRMLAFGNSAPASGGEHHISHYWEMTLLRAKRPAVFHGRQVGIAAVLTAQRYRTLRNLTRDQAAEHLQWSDQFSRDQQQRKIRLVYGPMADEIIKDQAAFLDWTAESFRHFRRRILDRWDEVQEIAQAVPEPRQLVTWLDRVHGPAEASAVGLSEAEVGDALEYSHYLRNRFTINKLWFALGLPQRQVTSP